LVLLSAAVGFASADVNSPTGLWKTIDDKTGKERSFVRITENNGVFEGKVEKIYDQPGDDPQHLCKECEGERKDKPIIGMTILWGLKKDGQQYAGGEILDPKNGSVYRAKMKLLDGGKKLEVRGFIGVSLFGRSQTWVREE
jgi:uncharacterized protein (DUF2147 family)